MDVNYRQTVIGMVVAICATGLWADKPAGDLWYDHAHGLIMTLPVQAHRVEDPIDEALIRIKGPSQHGGYNIYAVVKQNPKHKTIEQLTDQAMAEVSITAADPSLQEKRYVQLGGRDAAVIYYRHGNRNVQVIERVFKGAKKKPWIMGQALILLPSQQAPGVERLPSERLLVVHMDVDVQYEEQGKAAFESMLASLQIDDPKALAMRRMEQINEAGKWLKPLNFDDWRKACIADQLFMIKKGNRDIGYMRVRQSQSTELKHNGLRTIIEARYVDNDRAVDTLFNAFWSENDQNEFWSKVITERPDAPMDGRTRSAGAGTTWRETGVRSGEEITVVREGPAGKKTHQWDRPPNGYLSQVQVQLLGQMLKSAPKKELGFYAYLSSSNSITFRTDRIEAAADGYRVLSRPNPEKTQYVTMYDRKGQLKSQQLPDGTTTLPTTKAQLAARWKYGRR